MIIAKRVHPFPSRTRKLSSLAPMVLRGSLRGRVGRRRNLIKSPSFLTRGFFLCYLDFDEWGRLKRVGVLSFRIGQKVVDPATRGIDVLFWHRRLFLRSSKSDALVKSQKSHIFIISEEIRIQSLQRVVSVFSVRSVANCTFYEFIKNGS